MNFNKLAWEAPKHGNEYGYLPTNKEYNEIVKWLKGGTKLYTSRVGNKSNCRVRFENSNFDANVSYNHTTKLISWTFSKRNEYNFGSDRNDK